MKGNIFSIWVIDRKVPQQCLTLPPWISGIYEGSVAPKEIELPDDLHLSLSHRALLMMHPSACISINSLILALPIMEEGTEGRDKCIL